MPTVPNPNNGATNKPPTYRDLDFNIPLMANKTMGVKMNERDIIQSIKNIILSSVGEVPFTINRIGLFEKKFDTLSPIMRDLLESDIIRIVNAIEPRITINDVSVEQGTNSEVLSVTIKTTTLTVPRVERDIRIILNNTTTENQAG